MKKTILLLYVLLGFGIESYSNTSNKWNMEEVNRTVVKEIAKFYNGYEDIYSKGVDEKNINFIINEITNSNLFKVNYNYQDLKNKQIIVLGIDEMVELENIVQLKKLKVNKKTYKNSKVDFKKFGVNLRILFTGIGVYNITFTDKDGTSKEIIFKKVENGNFTESNINDNIGKSYLEGNTVFATDNLRILETFFPDSKNIEKTSFYALELNEKTENYEEVKRISQELINNFPLSSGKKAEVLDGYLNALDKLGEHEEYLKLLKKLYEHDKKYKDIFLDGAIKCNSYDLLAVELAKQELSEREDSRISDYVGDYYYNQGSYNEAANYYKASGNIEKLARLYLEAGQDSEYENLINNSDLDELNEIKTVETEYFEKKEIKKYIDTANIYVGEGRFREAELYYEKILAKGISKDQKNDIYYNLVDIYYNLNDLYSAKETIYKIDSKKLSKEYLSNYYYLGGKIHYDLEEYSSSIKYFENLVELYPNTPISHRARIYILKIKDNPKGE